MKSNRVEKRTKSDLVRFCFNHSNSTEGLKFALVNKESNVLVYDYRNTNVLLATVNPKPLLSMEVSTAQWDNSDSLLFLAGGEYKKQYLEIQPDLYCLSMHKHMNLFLMLSSLLIAPRLQILPLTITTINLQQPLKIHLLKYIKFQI
jgi:hypothetical protein